MSDKPHVVMLAGPNGAGKSTAAPALLAGTLGITEFVNADVIASGLSAFEPESLAVEAGRLMLQRLHQLAHERSDFAFETTLASRSFAPWIAELVEGGYAFHLFFLWLPNADHAVARVRERVKRGGHGIPEETIRRRYNRGIVNFFRLYQPLATTWRVYDNSGTEGLRLVAKGRGLKVELVTDASVWSQMSELAK